MNQAPKMLKISVVIPDIVNISSYNPLHKRSLESSIILNSIKGPKAKKLENLCSKGGHDKPLPQKLGNVPGNHCSGL